MCDIIMIFKLRNISDPELSFVDPSSQILSCLLDFSFFMVNEIPFIFAKTCIYPQFSGEMRQYILIKSSKPDPDPSFGLVLQVHKPRSLFSSSCEQCLKGLETSGNLIFPFGLEDSQRSSGAWQETFLWGI